jgi:hypothetical protein
MQNRKKSRNRPVYALVWYYNGWVCCHGSHDMWTPVLGSATLSERLIRSCARHRFVAASSRRTDENVASRRGSGRHCRSASRARALSLNLKTILMRMSQAIRRMILPKEATHNVLQKPCSLLLNQLGNHITEHSSNSIKPLICSTYVVETMVV